MSDSSEDSSSSSSDSNPALLNPAHLNPIQKSTEIQKLQFKLLKLKHKNNTQAIVIENQKNKIRQLERDIVTLRSIIAGLRQLILDSIQFIRHWSPDSP
mmetsp:Transcript_6385/g.5616  ORF Transcript_6385/g.5616 Transcript_6385/m.5616 type:complete len:99 (+) Transcript_6385:39-335(+)